MSSINVLVKRLEHLDKQVRAMHSFHCFTPICAIVLMSIPEFELFSICSLHFLSSLLKPSSNKRKIPASTNSNVLKSDARVRFRKSGKQSPSEMSSSKK